MDNSEKKIALPQKSDGGEDHTARILREKIGDILSIGQPAPAAPTDVAAADQKLLESEVIAALQTIYDPEIPLNIYDLGLIYRLAIAPTNAVKVEMTLTAPGCPVAGDIVAEVKRKLEAIPEVPRVEVELVWDPPWTRERLTEAARLELGMM
jgi:FeS assembly SUF system protein